MMLVLGKPGSGCSTFLRAITNLHTSFAEISGTVTYGGIPSNELLKHYRAEIVYSEEDDIHFPVLTVRQTLLFALLTKFDAVNSHWHEKSWMSWEECLELAKCSIQL